MNHIHSPRTCDASIEEDILKKGLTGPRVTPAAMEANIASEYFFTASEGIFGAAINAGAQPEQAFFAPNEATALLTFCVLILRNGFTVTGESACACPENFDAEIGKKIARANAVQKIWSLMGYALKESLSADNPS